MSDSTTAFELILFGAAGDLSLRKLIPSLYCLHLDQRIHPEGRIIAVARRNYEREDFLKVVKKALIKHLNVDLFDEETWNSFAKRLSYAQMDITDPASYDTTLKHYLNRPDTPKVFYLATHSDMYGVICQHLYSHQMLRGEARVVLEKPIGMDYQSAVEVCKEVDKYCNEEQIYRIDHYLGKETVQNLLALRFANSIFEHQWNQRYIDHIQITIAETLGVEQRAGFYEAAGAMRDMMQNHLLQLLCMVAMEPPAQLNAESIRDEKVKVLKALKPITGELINANVVRGQYQEGSLNGQPTPAYREEPGVNPHSDTETFVSMKVEIDNWRWAGTPFYLRTGKRLPDRACEIVIQFKEVPHSVFELQHPASMANKLIFRLQPDDGIKLQLCEKRVGKGMSVKPVLLNLTAEHARKDRVPDAYERLLSDAIEGNPTLFLREDELLTAWQWIDPILKAWEHSGSRPEFYHGGIWGPAASTLLLARDGRLWQENH
ncbi:glucose-6-phosphate 1-dehydrogenase [Litoribrevibacter albus]|uniref:Glucose-6-phosphate 1-dehydrogenase n=2 Tax=Litoribrevibacter albus TaxID=1473156 RepID=A0AA37S7E3_9GAMM|nr:glucose-6-phosphate 1-dehydrogenase [Litoribrevibacter albus]